MGWAGCLGVLAVVVLFGLYTFATFRMRLV
jgi:hypothetical protein